MTANRLSLKPIADAALRRMRAQLSAAGSGLALRALTVTGAAPPPR